MSKRKMLLSYVISVLNTVPKINSSVNCVIPGDAKIQLFGIYGGRACGHVANKSSVTLKGEMHRCNQSTVTNLF